MGWFSNDKKEDKKTNSSNFMQSQVPSLPSLARLPDLPKLNFNLNEDNDSEVHDPTEQLPKLPSFPSSSFGNKLSQDTIKEAVSGGKERGGEDVNDIDFDQRMRRPVRKSNTIEEEDFEDEIPYGFKDAAKKVRSIEPVFVRIDKFEEGLKIFEETKIKISEIESMLKEVKELKSKEEKELFDWESEIQSIKRDMEKIDNDIFSKIE